MEPHALKFDLSRDGLFQVGGMSQHAFSNKVERVQPLD
jgi:hypothetical protein